MWDSTPPEISIPEAALVSWEQSPDPRPAINRIYTGGTTHGVLLQLTRAGTAGDRCPNEPILDSLLTDVYAARARAEADLAGGGPGFTISVETLLGGGVPLVRPGDLVEFAGMRGINRATRIRLEKSSDGLAVGVIQELTLERRIGPWL